MPQWPMVIVNGFLEVNGVGLSDHGTQVALNVLSETVDATAWGAGFRRRKAVVKDWSATVTVQQDYATGKVNKTIGALMGTTACFEFRPENTCTTTINPSFSGIGIVKSYEALKGNFGEIVAAQITIEGANDLSSASSS